MTERVACVRSAETKRRYTPGELAAFTSTQAMRSTGHSSSSAMIGLDFYAGFAGDAREHVYPGSGAASRSRKQELCLSTTRSSRSK